MTNPPLNSYEVVTEGPGIPEGSIKISFALGEAPFIFSDAIVVQSGVLTQAEIDAEIQRRYDIWYELVTAPIDPAPEE